MKNMREQIVNIGNKVIDNLGSVAVNVAEKSVGDCWFLSFYEPEVPIELLKENIKE